MVATVNFDRVLDRIGIWGRYQWYTYFLIGLSGTVAGVHNLINYFITATPGYHCAIPELNHLSFQHRGKFSVANAQSQACHVYNLDYVNISLTSESPLNATQAFYSNLTAVRECTEWEYSDKYYDNTITTEWHLVCDSAWKKATAQSIYMLGFLVGTVLYGALSDRCGRKFAWLIAMSTVVLAGVPAALTPEFWSHVWLRFIQGVGSAGFFTCGFVLVMEIIGTEKRMIPGIFYQGFFACGYMLMSLIAHYVRDYQSLLLGLSVYPAIFLSYYWLVGESPRWLLAQGRTEEAVTILKRAAKFNKQPFPEDLFQEEAKLIPDKTPPPSEPPSNSIFDLVRTPNMRKKSLNIFFNWFVNSLVYYGLSMGASQLAGSPQLNLFLSGVAEFPGYILACVTLDRLGRRRPLAGLLVVGGVSCLIIPAVPTHLWMVSTGFSLLGKMCISGSFAVIYVYSAEIFPTVVRNVGVGTGSMHARIGGLVAPFIMEMSSLWFPLPFLVMGSCSVVAGFLTLVLPETLNQRLPESIEDGENFGKKMPDAFLNGDVCQEVYVPPEEETV